MKKTIIVSILTTLTTMFVVAVMIHMCRANCGGNLSCSKQAKQCNYASSECGQSSSCASYSKCRKQKSCCKSQSKCSKDKSCEKDGQKFKCTSNDGKKVIKKVVKTDEEVKK